MAPEAQMGHTREKYVIAIKFFLFKLAMRHLMLVSVVSSIDV